MLKVDVTDRDHMQGAADAPVVLVEYGDYECPHCGHAHPIVRRLQKHFGKKLAFVFRNFPLNQIHANAESAAETAEFAGSKQQFWPMHDAIFENQQNLSIETLVELAEGLKLSQQDLVSALESHEFTPRVKEDFTGGVRSGVNGTPTFFINGQRYDGSVDYEELAMAIETAIAENRA